LFQLSHPPVEKNIIHPSLSTFINVSNKKHLKISSFKKLVVSMSIFCRFDDDFFKKDMEKEFNCSFRK